MSATFQRLNSEAGRAETHFLTLQFHIEIKMGLSVRWGDGPLRTP